MITFDCARCGMKFKVKDEFAGRTTRCSTCKHSLTVPAADLIGQFVSPNGAIDGTPSSVAQAGVAGDVSLKSNAPDTPGEASVRELLAGRPTTGQRYVLDREIARGGMGAVLRAIDCDIRREVAVKYMLKQTDPRHKARFVEEAQITGQLEHPNIVPIHELGVDGQGRMFFTMKMVKGRSLAQVLDELRHNPQHAEKDWPLPRLLTICVNICHALAYAHGRGVIHRDLKPANVMIGDFGEVYVMDWGLAKVVHESAAPTRYAQTAGDEFAQFMDQRSAAPPPLPSAPGQRTVPLAAPVSGSGLSASSSGKVATSRQDADLTQEGAVVGTPVYMPPEQAMGKLQEIDRRSDVYALGAILYELLTLQPPIEKEGGFAVILLRVMRGAIAPPEQRSPERFQAGKVPPELSAIAMKALAKEPKDRYQTVDAFRRDVELFQEGRSVSARPDSARAMIRKFVKRNKAVSGVAAAAALLVLVVFAHGWWTNRQSRLATEKAYATSLEEQSEKEKRTRRAVPAFVGAARQLAAAGEFEKAMVQADFALEYAPDGAEARLLRGQILIAQKDFAAGRAELEQYLKLRPSDADAQKLAELCRGKTDDPRILLAMVEVYQRQKSHALGAHLLQEVKPPPKPTPEERKQLLALYQKQIDGAWPGLGYKLELKDGELALILGKLVLSLEPLRGMALNRLSMDCHSVTDLSPLKGMPLTRLSLVCGAIDLSPLKGMSLTHLALHCPASDLSPLKGMPLTSLSGSFDEVADLSLLQGMPLTTLSMRAARVTDLSPLRGMQLTSLVFQSGQFTDLSPLKGMPLSQLYLPSCAVNDLSPLSGLPLTDLNLEATAVQSLTPLKGMPLQNFNLVNCATIRDLSPLEGMSLKSINLPPNVDRGMKVLRAMQSLRQINRLAADVFWRTYDAGEFKQYKD